jgi:hypothetical protein
LHDPAQAGGDYRERERIKKKKTRWQDRFAAMGPRERQAIAEALWNVDRAAVEAAVRTATPVVDADPTAAAGGGRRERGTHEA